MYLKMGNFTRLCIILWIVLATGDAFSSEIQGYERARVVELAQNEKRTVVEDGQFSGDTTSLDFSNGDQSTTTTPIQKTTFTEIESQNIESTTRGEYVEAIQHIPRRGQKATSPYDGFDFDKFNLDTTTSASTTTEVVTQLQTTTITSDTTQVRITEASSESTTPVDNTSQIIESNKNENENTENPFISSNFQPEQSILDQIQIATETAQTSITEQDRLLAETTPLSTRDITPNTLEPKETDNITVINSSETTAKNNTVSENIFSSTTLATIRDIPITSFEYAERNHTAKLTEKVTQLMKPAAEVSQPEDNNFDHATKKLDVSENTPPVTEDLRVIDLPYIPTGTLSTKKPIKETYTVGPNVKPYKKLEIKPPKPVWRDPDDNTWRNESISSLGIAIKPNDSPKPFTFKNRSVSLLNESEGPVENTIALRKKLEKLSLERKFKKTSPWDTYSKIRHEYSDKQRAGYPFYINSDESSLHHVDKDLFDFLDEDFGKRQLSSSSPLINAFSGSSRIFAETHSRSVETTPAPVSNFMKKPKQIHDAPDRKYSIQSTYYFGSPQVSFNNSVSHKETTKLTRNTTSETISNMYNSVKDNNMHIEEKKARHHQIAPSSLNRSQENKKEYSINHDTKSNMNAKRYNPVEEKETDRKPKKPYSSIIRQQHPTTIFTNVGPTRSDFKIPQFKQQSGPKEDLNIMYSYVSVSPLDYTRKPLFWLEEQTSEMYQDMGIATAKPFYEIKKQKHGLPEGYTDEKDWR